MDLAPIILFVYNRLWHTMQTVEALKKNILAKKSKLIIYSDGPKNHSMKPKVDEVREYIKSIEGFKDITIITREHNYGLSKSLIDGITQTVNNYKKIIVLEDDLVTSRYFLTFMNDGLEIYEKENSVASIHGYTLPIDTLGEDTFFIRGTDCQGWATWARAWNHFEPKGELLLKEILRKNIAYEFNYDNTYPYTKMLEDQISGKIDSWAIRWYASIFLMNMYTLYSGVSHVNNIGFDESGINSKTTEQYNVLISKKYTQIKKEPIIENIKVRENKKLFYKKIAPTIFDKTKKKIKDIFSV